MTTKLEARPLLTAEDLDEYLGTQADVLGTCSAVERYLRIEYGKAGARGAVTGAAFRLQKEISSGGVVALGLQAAKDWIRQRIASGDVLAPEGVS